MSHSFKLAVFSVVSSRWTKDVVYEVPPTVVCQEAIGETNHSDIGPRDGRAVSNKERQSLDGINYPFQAKDSTISVIIVHLNFQALLGTGAAVAAVSTRAWQKCVIDISLN